MTPRYRRHAFQEEIIYPAMMAELTGEDPENYRNRPFDMDLLDYRPSAYPHDEMRAAAAAETERMRTASDVIAATAAAAGATIGPARRPRFRRLTDWSQA